MGETISVAAGTSLREHFERKSGDLDLPKSSFKAFSSFSSDNVAPLDCGPDAVAATEGVTPLQSRLIPEGAELELASATLPPFGRKLQHHASRAREGIVAGASLGRDAAGTADSIAAREGGKGVAVAYPLAAVWAGGSV